MPQSNADLAALIGSRICHDLISPIGAINNGLELLGMTGDVSGPELELIADSVENAGARIRFFRIAYGASGDQSLGQGEICALLRDMSQAGRVRYEWIPSGPQRRADVRLAFLALQCCETALPYGGKITLDVTAGTWRVTGSGASINADAALWDGLTMRETAAQLTPATVQFALLPVLAHDADRQLSTDIGAESVTIVF